MIIAYKDAATHRCEQPFRSPFEGCLPWRPRPDGNGAAFDHSLTLQAKVQTQLASRHLRTAEIVVRDARTWPLRHQAGTARRAMAANTSRKRANGDQPRCQAGADAKPSADSTDIGSGTKSKRPLN